MRQRERNVADLRRKSPLGDRKQLQGARVPLPVVRGHSIVIFSPECPVLNEHMNVPADILGFDFAIARVVNDLGA
jgi:hypothetical protein